MDSIDTIRVQREGEQSAEKRRTPVKRERESAEKRRTPVKRERESAEKRRIPPREEKESEKDKNDAAAGGGM
ncbi:MAG: hypothetical protein NC432_00625 [Roseburia sp.]|nr:hypothetical protein [Roseburia sp.]